MNNKTTFAIACICIISTVLLVTLAVMVPGLSVIFMFAASVAVAYSFIRCGMGCGVVLVASSVVTALLLGDFQAEVLIVPAFGLVPGVMSGVMTKRNAEYYQHLMGVVSGF